MINHKQIQAWISAYYDGEANEQERQAVTDHILDCPACRNYFNDLAKISSSLKQWPDAALSPDQEHKIQKDILSVKKREGPMKTERYSWNIIHTCGLAVAALLVVGIFMRPHHAPGRLVRKNATPAETTPVAQIALAPQPEPAAQTAATAGQSGPAQHQQLAGLKQKGDLPVGPNLDEGYVLGEVQRPMASEQLALARTDTTDSSIAFKGDGKDLSKSVTTTNGMKDKEMDAGLAQLAQPVAGGYVRFSEDSGRIRSPGGYQGAPASPDTSFGLGLGYETGREGYRQKAIAIPQRPYRYIDSQPFIDVVPNNEQYDTITENTFQQVSYQPLSTFSVDVDTASYSNVRRYLNNRQLPPADAVRVEELVNYFVYDYPQPSAENPLSVSTETAACPWNPGHLLTMIGIQGYQLSGAEMPPSNLVFLIDVSGSMQDANKLPLLKESFRQMVRQLRPEERVAIVTYAGQAGLALDSTPGNQKNRILNAIDALQAGGSTAGAEGIRLAYRIARQNFIPNGNNRVILATDGDFNVGISSDSELVRLIEQERQGGVFLSVLGFGTGNYKDGKMEKLADRGNGNYYYIDTLQEGRKVLVQELGSMLFPIAKDVKLQVEFNPARVQSYRLVGYENRALAAQDFNDDRKDAGEMGAGHTVTAFYEIVPVGAEVGQTGAVDPLIYQQPGQVRPSNDLLTVKLRYKLPQGEQSSLITQRVMTGDIREIGSTSNNYRFASAVAEFGLLLRDSEFKGQASYNAVRSRAQSALGNDAWGYRREFLGLVDMADQLSAGRYLDPDPEREGYYSNKGL